jgi:penicillin amidase
MDGNPRVSAENHWQFQRDTRNLLAERLAPWMAEVLATRTDTRAMAEILSRWNFDDAADQAAPTIFQAVLRRFAFQVFQDELGDKATAVYLDNWYLWQERLLDMTLKNDGPWFDDIRTPGVKESRNDLLHRAAREAADDLESRMGSDPRQWIWGKVHRLELVSPIRRKGFGKGLLGGGSHAFAGSGETLYRGWYDVDAPFGVTHSASLRMVADLADDDKVMAVLPGGVAGRVFHPHATDQIDAFINGETTYWWFSDREIQAHACNVLHLTPSRR